MVLADDVSVIDCPPMTIDYEIASLANPTNFIDKAGYEFDLRVELEHAAELNAWAAAGISHSHTLYSFRSSAKAIPLVFLIFTPFFAPFVDGLCSF